MSGRGSETVESYWNKLQKENGKSGGSFNRVWSSINKSGYPSTKLADQSGKKAEKEEEKSGNGATLPEKRPGTMKESSQNCQATIPSASPLPLVSNGDFLDEQELDRFLHPQLERLKSPSSQAKVQALQCLQAVLSKSGILQKVIQDASCVTIAKGLLDLFDDQAERCREGAIKTLMTILKGRPDSILALLPYVLPVLAERIQRTENPKGPVESSEEIRLLLLGLLKEVVVHAERAIGPYGGDTCGMIQAACEDNYHEVNIAACECMQSLARLLGMQLHAVSKELVASFMPLLTHKRQKVRIEAIRTIRRLMHCGAHEMLLEMTAFVDPNVIAIKAFYEGDQRINFCGKLATDSSIQVRREFLEAIGDWMHDLRERADHQTRLLPYALGALSDPSPEVAAAALALIEKLGLQYEQENAADLKDKLDYLPQEAHALGWQPAGLMERI